MKERPRRLARLALAIAACLSLPLTAWAQNLAAPGELRADGPVLSWTATPGDGVKYLIERSGPGLTFFTPIAGPIADTHFQADISGSKECGRGAQFTFRVRAFDSSATLSPYSNSVRIPLGPCTVSLPMVGRDPLALITTLPGYRATSFILESVTDGMFAFTSNERSQSFTWKCADCSFIVGPDGVGPTRPGRPGVEFKLSPDGAEISATCRAARCDVTTSATVRQVGAEQTITIPSNVQATFTVREIRGQPPNSLE